MLNVFFGNDVVAVRQKAFDFLHAQTSPDSLITHITSDKYEEGMISDFAEGTSLFGGENVYVIDTPSEEAAVLENIIEYLPMMRDSGNQFIIIESTLTAPIKKKLAANADSMDEVEGEKKEKFNAFLLTDALLRRDKKSLWLLLTEAWKSGLSNEEIIGVLSWQIKTLRLVEKAKNAEESGQKPFVYNKAKRALANFKKGELDEFSKTLLTIYHEGHMGKRDASLALEEWVLGV